MVGADDDVRPVDAEPPRHLFAGEPRLLLRAQPWCRATVEGGSESTVDHNAMCKDEAAGLPAERRRRGLQVRAR